MKQQKIRGSLYLTVGTVIWGCAFVAQSVGMEYIGPMTFMAGRCVLAVLALLPVTFLVDKKKTGFAARWLDRKLWMAGIPCGLALFLATALQQVGLLYTEPGKAGFITAMYIVLVPVLGLFLGKKCGSRIWLSVALAVAGLYLLSCVGVTKINLGDLLILGAAAAFAVQITLIDRLAQDLDGLRLNGMQFAVVGLLSTLAMLLTEEPTWGAVMDCAWPLLYTGLLSSAVAYSLQILGQQLLPPAPASLIMSLESVFAVLAGWLVLGQTMSAVETAGCVLVFGAVLLSQSAEQ